MTAKKTLRPEIEKALPLGGAVLRSSVIAPICGSPRWDTLMELARTTARQRQERTRIVGGWATRPGSPLLHGEHRWTYVIECASWCGCREGGQG